MRERASERSRDLYSVSMTVVMDETTALEVALDASSSPKQLMGIARLPYPQVRAVLARHPQANSSVLALLIDDKSLWSALAGHEACGASTLGFLANRRDDLALAVARNARCPRALLAHLATHANPLIRGAVARHPRTPGVILGWLKEDSDASVRASLLEHPALTYHTLLELTVDRSSMVADRALERLALKSPEASDAIRRVPISR